MAKTKCNKCSTELHLPNYDSFGSCPGCKTPLYVKGNKIGYLDITPGVEVLLRRRDKLRRLVESFDDSIVEFFEQRDIRVAVDNYEKTRIEETRAREKWNNSRARLKHKNLSSIFKDVILDALEDGEVSYKEANRLLDGMISPVNELQQAVAREVWLKWRVR